MSTTIVNGGSAEEPAEVIKWLESHYRRLGTRDPVCAWPDCGQTHPAVLIRRCDRISCYEHYTLSTGRRPYEAHHVAGRQNSDATADVPGNDHRILSELQRLWPEDTLRNPEHSPLIVAAASIRGWCDVLLVIIYRGVGWIPDFLEWLHLTLVDQHGPDYWTRLGWDDDQDGR